MATTKILGAWGETLAAQYLQKKRYRLEAAGYRCKYGEIDLIVSNRKYLVFVEVKYRENDKSGHPLEAVSVSKQRTISKCAFYYLQKPDWNHHHLNVLQR